MIVLGADPGKGSGGIVVLEDRAKVLAWVGWSELKGGRVKVCGACGGFTSSGEAPIGDMYRGIMWHLDYSRPPDRYAIEEVRAIGNANTVVLIEHAGMLQQAIRQEFGFEGEFVRTWANQWRKRQLGLGRVSADAAERYAIERAAIEMDWTSAPLEVPNAEMRGAISEAAFIARDATPKAKAVEEYVQDWME